MPEWPGPVIGALAGGDAFQHTLTHDAQHRQPAERCEAVRSLHRILHRQPDMHVQAAAAVVANVPVGSIMQRAQHPAEVSAEHASRQVRVSEDWRDDLDAFDRNVVVVEDAALPDAGETGHRVVRWEVVEEAARSVGEGLDGGVSDQGPDVEVGGFTLGVCACAVAGDVYACSMEGEVEC